MSNKRYAFILSAILVVSIIGSIGVLYGAHKYIMSRASHFSNLKAEDEAGQQRLAQLGKIEGQLKKYQDFTAISEQVMPTKYDQTEINLIVRLAAQSGISLSTIGVGSGPGAGTGAAPASPGAGGTSSAACASPLVTYKPAPGVCSVTFRIQPNGTVSFGQFMDFLTRIEQSRRKIVVTNLTISPTGDNASRLNFAADLNMFTRPK